VWLFSLPRGGQGAAGLFYNFFFKKIANNS